jgi:hypothetical protein
MSYQTFSYWGRSPFQLRVLVTNSNPVTTCASDGRVNPYPNRVVPTTDTLSHENLRFLANSYQRQTTGIHGGEHAALLKECESVNWPLVPTKLVHY